VILKNRSVIAKSEDRMKINSLFYSWTTRQVVQVHKLSQYYKYQKKI